MDPDRSDSETGHADNNKSYTICECRTECMVDTISFLLLRKVGLSISSGSLECDHLLRRNHFVCLNVCVYVYNMYVIRYHS